MVKKEKKTPALLTESLPEEQADLARGIQSNGHDSFMTGIYNYYQSDEGGQKHLYWLEAWQHPQSNLWMVEKHTHRISGPDDPGQRSHRTLAPQICFMDALDLCAGFENNESLKQAPVIRTDNPANKPHFRDVGYAALVPFDRDGMPHLAAYGRILTEGAQFDAAAYELAARTKGREIEPVPASVPSKKAAADMFGGAAGKRSTAMIKRGNSWGALTTGKIRNALEAATDLLGVVMAAQSAEIKGPRLLAGLGPEATNYDAAPLIFTIMTLGTFYPVYCAFKYKNADSLKTRFNKKRNAFHNKIAALPRHHPARPLLREFSEAAAVAFALEEAAYILDRCEQGKMAEKDMRRGIKLVEKTARQAGRSDEDIANYITIYKQGEFPRRGHFAAKLRTELADLRKTLGAAP